MTRNAVWNIDEKEAQALAEASANVARHYNATLDPKWADIIVLIGLIGTMYAPRIMVTFMKPKAQKSQAQQPVEKAPTDMSFSNLPNIPGVPMTH